MPTGRPTKYKKRYCEDVIEHMKNGASFTSFAAKIEVDDSQIRRWKQKYPDFYTACKIAEKKSQQWWENLATMVATGKHMDIETDPRKKDKFGKPKLPHINSGMIQFIMKQRFYRDYNKAPYTAPEDQNKQEMEFKISYDPKDLKD